MEALLPSEIARLILGYLEEENCPEVAKMFLESSPLLRECYSVTQRGGKFTRRVNGVTLTNLLDKYCAINALVQERLSKVEDCESLKTSGDLLDQLRFLMDGSRSQRFVVNINVPTQNASQTSGGSPIISSSMRKRRHSGPVDRDRSKKVHKSNSPLLDRRSEPNILQCCDTVETTSLEQLPGHQNSSEGLGTPQEEDRRAHCSSTSTEPSSGLKDVSDNMDMSTSLQENLSEEVNPQKAPEASSQTCETGTDTKELTAFTNTEVQTAPCEGFDTAEEMGDGPVENLSLLTKELLNRTELQERIAQTINRTLIPAEASLRDASFSEATSGDCNTSIMRELDHAIKSIVMETETDPVFEQFLLETIGQGIEGETSPDEDGACSPKDNVQEDLGETEKASEGNQQKPEDPEVVEDVADQAQQKEPLLSTSADLPVEKDLLALDDVNAEAILSIINVSNTTKELNQEKSIPELQIQEILPLPVVPVITADPVPDPAVPQVEMKSRRKRAPKPKKEKKQLTPKKEVTEQEVVPTLIVCSQQEINSMKIPVVRPKSQYVPIMPKTSGMITPSDPTLYLRTVNVVRSKPAPKASSFPSSTNLQPLDTSQPSSTNAHLSEGLEAIPKSGPQASGLNESITLYGPESDTAVVEANLPAVQVEESMSLTGTGLSPFLKMRERSTAPQESNPPEGEVNKEERRLNSQFQASSDILMKRTPRSIMKSRSRNHRLSLSTPRRRSSHIRALDFNTPTKGLNSSRRLSDAEKSCAFSPKSSKGLSKACRTSLFKSPPFVGSPSPKKKGKTPSKLCKGQIPIATRSPAPKLIGDWDKIAGVGMIIDSSSQSSCPSPAKSMPAPVSEVKRPWDSDLRMKVAADVQPVEPHQPKKERPVRRRRSLKKGKNDEEEGTIISDDEADRVPAAGDATDQRLGPETNGNPLEKSIDEGPTDKKSVEAVDEKSEEADIEVAKETVESITKICKIVTEQGITKKYAKLKTLTTTVTKVESNKRSNPRTPGESLDKSSDFGRIDHSKLLDLETPRKFDPNLIPPTPRVLSPGSNMTTPFAQISESSGKIQSFVSTPEFPPTPSINLTPKQTNDSTMNDNKKEFVSSYYQPSTELKETRMIRTGNPVEMILESSPIMASKISSQSFQATTSQLEITQFEVIKENLPKEQAIKELKLSRTEIQMGREDGNKEPKIAGDTPNKSSKTLESSGTAEDSSDSDSDSSSSSSSSSSSCSCCDTTNTSSKMSTSRKSRKTPHKVDCSNTNDFTLESPTITDNKTKIGVDELMRKTEVSPEDSSKENIDSQKMNEKSPMKMIPMIKTDDILNAIDFETPAKDEGLLSEADISETPSSSKAGIESLTNLNSKISAIIKEDNAKPRLSASITSKARPKVISIEKVSPILKLRKMTEQDVETANKTFMDAKLARELDEKRLRMINKLKSDNAPRTRGGRSKENVKERNAEPIAPAGRSQPQQQEEPLKKPEKPEKSQPTRKSMRNVQRRAKRGLSEPTDSIKSEKIEPPRKAQSSRDSSANDDGNLEIIMLPSINPPTIVQLGRILPDVDANLEDQNNKIHKDLIADEKKEEIKVKSKVDLVKRDLFSDDENTDGKPLNPRPRKLSESHKSESVDSAELKQPIAKSEELPGVLAIAKPEELPGVLAIAKPEELPGVLESLELVPANKSLDEADLDVGTYEHIEISFVYDEDQPRRKRKKKLSSSDLEMKVQVYTCTGEIVWKNMTSTPHEEIFNLNPPRKKRVPKENPTKPKIPREKPVTTVVASKRKGKPQLKNSESVVSEIKSQPLATSSPVSKEVPPKTAEKAKTGGKNKPEDKPSKPRKRKQSETKDEPVEKKPRTTDPAALLSGININKLLNVVHGSES